MRDDAVLGRALPLDRGLGPKRTGTVCLVSYYKGSSINMLQNDAVSLVF